MSRSLQKNKYQNYLTLINNCKVVSSGAKPLLHLNPENILTDNIREVWLSNELPAVCIIDFRNAIQKPVYFNRIGFNCWHQYESNPKLIEIEYTGQDNPENAVWVVLTKIRLQLASGWQHFKLPTIQTKNISYLKIKIMQNHAQLQDQDENGQNSQSNTYLNQVSLGYVQDIIESRVQLTAANNINLRQKTYSDYRKLTTSQKQIKKLTQKVKHLSNDNQTMRRTIDHQNSIIIKLQQAVQTLAQNVSKLQKIQTVQQTKIKQLQKGRYHTKNNQQASHHKEKIQQFFDDESQIVPSIQEKNLSKQKHRSHHNSIYQEHPSQLSKHNNSTYKSSKGKSNQKSNNSKKRQVINANIDQSEESLSQYEGVVDQRVYRYTKKGAQKNSNKEQTYIPMLQKLQELIMLRDEKRNKLKTQKKPRKSEHVIASSQNQDSSDSDQ